MKNQIAHITRRISIVAGLVAAFTLAPALSNLQSADAAPRRERFERRQDRREDRFERREDRRENRFERRNNRWRPNRNNSWNNRRDNRRYHTKYRTIWRNGHPIRQYYRVYY